MAFKLFERPKSWPAWLEKALLAEKICVQSGMNKEMAHHIMAFETPDKILQFIREFSDKPDREVDNAIYSRSGSSHDGTSMRTWRSPS